MPIVRILAMYCAAPIILSCPFLWLPLRTVNTFSEPPGVSNDGGHLQAVPRAAGGGRGHAAVAAALRD